MPKTYTPKTSTLHAMRHHVSTMAFVQRMNPGMSVRVLKDLSVQTVRRPRVLSTPVLTTASVQLTGVVINAHVRPVIQEQTVKSRRVRLLRV